MTPKEDDAPELYRKHRPRLLKHIKGQKEAIQIVSTWLKNDSIPHSILIVGPSGTGKTTIGRILKEKLECADLDFCEINAAEARGIDTIRSIDARRGLSASGGKNRMWLIDESHKLTGDSQSCLLKILEDSHSHSYFILATTDPQKLLPTIKTRCSVITLKSLTDGDLKEVLKDIVEKEKKSVSEEVIDALVKSAEGSARRVLVNLQQIIDLPEQDQLGSISFPETEKQAYDILKALLWTKTTWKEMALILQKTKEANEDPERLRHYILASANKELLKATHTAPRAFLVITEFAQPFHENKEAGLAAACYQILRTK